MKVLMVGNHPSNRGGMTTVVNQLIHYNWDSKNIKMKFIPTFYPGNSVLKLSYFIVSCFRVFISLLIYRPDLVHMHMSYKGSFYRNYTIHRLCKVFSVKDVVHLHGTKFEDWYYSENEKKKKTIRRLLKECDAFIVVGEKRKKQIERIEEKANVVAIANSVEITGKTVSWNEQQINLLYLGVLEKSKGLNDLIEVIGSNQNYFRENRVCVEIAGSGTEGDILEKQCKKHEISDLVRFRGWISGAEKDRLIQKSQILILPSYTEGLPMSVLEAISCGMPVIATDVGDISEAVINGWNGFLFEPGDRKNMFAYIKKISSDKELYMQFSKNAVQLSKEKFSSEVFFEKCYELYKSLISR